MKRSSIIVAVTVMLMATAPVAASDGEPSAERQRELVRLVRQDCGSCHGLTLAGGLGPPLLPENLAEKHPEALAATIIHGRPGTAMPSWRAFLDEREAVWVVRRLMTGFPQDDQGMKP